MSKEKISKQSSQSILYSVAHQSKVRKPGEYLADTAEPLANATQLIPTRI